jgi:hypothetical protein
MDSEHGSWARESCMDEIGQARGVIAHGKGCRDQ